MNTYYLAILIAILILGSTFLITSWGFVIAQLKYFIKEFTRRIKPVPIISIEKKKLN